MTVRARQGVVADLASRRTPISAWPLKCGHPEPTGKYFPYGPNESLSGLSSLRQDWEATLTSQQTIKGNMIIGRYGCD